jgi:hypothetical protein
MHGPNRIALLGGRLILDHVLVTDTALRSAKLQSYECVGNDRDLTRHTYAKACLLKSFTIPPQSIGLYIDHGLAPGQIRSNEHSLGKLAIGTSMDQPPFSGLLLVEHIPCPHAVRLLKPYPGIPKERLEGEQF